jgi:2-methylcitrate dehydratase
MGSGTPPLVTFALMTFPRFTNPQRMETFMQRRNFITRTVSMSSATLLTSLLTSAPFRPAFAASSAAVIAESTEQKLAKFALAVRYENLPIEVVTSVKRIVLDTLGCALGAVGSDAANIAEKTVRRTFGEGKVATVIGYPQAASVEAAAFINGVLVRSLDLNDTYIGTEPLHPSEVLPTALALCEERKCSGREFMEALVAGYEASMRVTDAISFIERGFHPLCAMSYGVPLIAGKLWNLPPNAIAQAVGVSAARGYTSFVVNSGAISMMKAMGLSMTAVDGILTTRLAAEGFTGPQGTLEWLATKMKPNKPDFTLDLEPAAYRIPRVAFKRFPIQIELQSVAEAGSALHAKVRGRTQDIREIKVGSYPGIIERVADAAKFKPETKGTADHSMPVCLALALLEGDVTVAQFERDRWRDSDVKALVGKTSVKPSEALMAKLPKGRGASVEIVFNDGQTLREVVEVPEGDASRPLSQASLERKFNAFAIPVVGAATAAKIVSTVNRIDELTDLGQLARLLKGEGQPKFG